MCSLLSEIRPIYLLIFLTRTILLYCITVNIHHIEIPHAKTRIELTKVTIPSFLNDVIRVSAPMINEQSEYYLHNPNGEAMKLDIRIMEPWRRIRNQEIPNVVAQYRNDMKPAIITQRDNFEAIDYQYIPKDMFEQIFQEMDKNEFMIGPLSEEDGGNWVLSIFTKDFNGDLIEMFQVITVLITETVPVFPQRVTLQLGETFNLRFAYSLPDLETCELVAPRSTFDRLFDRNHEIDMASCGFTVPNITESDSGLWKIIGVGKITYKGDVMLNIDNTDQESEADYP